jgi:hypothetical protein
MTSQEVRLARRGTGHAMPGTHPCQGVGAARLVDAQTCSDGIAVCGTRYSPLRCFAGLPGSIRYAQMDMPDGVI